MEDGGLVGVACRRDDFRIAFTDVPVTIRGRIVSFAIPGSKEKFEGAFTAGGPNPRIELQSTTETYRYAGLTPGGNYCGQD